MTAGQLEALTWAVVLLPFPFALACALTGRAQRLRRILVVAYAVAGAASALTLLDGFLDNGGSPALGGQSLERFGFPLFLFLLLGGAGCALYAGFRREGPGHILCALVLAGTGLAAASVLATGLAAHAVLFEAVTVAALAGLAAHGRVGFRRRFRAFLPWLVSDGLFLAAVLLCVFLLDESVTLVEPPITSGTEAQVVIIGALFLAAALVRLGVFPFGFWHRELLAGSDPAWSSFFLGLANWSLSGMRVVVAVVFIGRLVASDWSLGLVLAGLASVVAGPALALRRRSAPDMVAGMYTMQAGFLLTGLGLFSRQGLEASLFCLVTAPLFLTAAIMAAGTAAGAGTGAALEGRDRGRRPREAPGAFAALLFAGVALAGLPPFDGFVGKALVAIGAFDKSSLDPFYALAGGVCLVGVGTAALAVAWTVGRASGAGTTSPRGDAGSAMEGAVALAFCGGSLFLGLFPGGVLRNFSGPASRLLFPPETSGPGVAFRGAGQEAARAAAHYLGWSQDAAAFLLAVTALALVAYFAARPVPPAQAAEPQKPR